MDIINFHQINGTLATSGQPTEEDFTEISNLGYKTIINLALTTSDNAIINEGDIVLNNHMTYVHIPIQWDNPTIEQFDLFCSILNLKKGNKVWVHCAFNMRVSAFVYLYNILHNELSQEQAEKHLHQIWQPSGIWEDFIQQMKKVKKTLTES